MKENLKELADLLPQAIFELDLDGNVTFTNKSGYTFLGYSEEDFEKGLNAKRFIASNEHDKLIQNFLKSIKGENIGGYEYTIIRKDKSSFPAIVYTSPIIKENVSVGLRGILIDITDRVKTEKSLRESEERYRILFEKNLAGVFRSTIAGKMIECNQAFASILGYSTPEELISYNSQLLYNTPEERERFISKILQNNEMKNYEICLKRKDGTLIWVLENVSIIFDADGKPEFFQGTIFDVTQRKQAQEQMNMLAAAIKSISECITITDKYNHLIFVNDAFLSVYGYKEEEILGKSLDVLRSENNPPEVLNKIRPSTLAGGWNGELFNKRKDGTEFPIYLSTAVVRNDEGELLAFIGVSSDITERKKVIKELIEAKENAEEANRLKSGFLSTMSHEIRTPLNAILGISEVLKDEFYNSAEADIKQFFTAMEDAGGRLLNTITQILDISRIEANEFEVNIEDIAVNNIIIKNYNFLRSLSESKNLTLNLDLDQENPFVKADEYCLNGVIINLISNSIKYSEKGEIKIKTSSDGEFISFMVKDEGVGMTEEYQKHLFETFSQEDVGVARRYEGTGLGLAITKRYLELMNGSITVESKKGIGTQIIFKLPKAF